MSKLSGVLGKNDNSANGGSLDPRRAIVQNRGTVAALAHALQSPGPLVVGAALAALNNLLYVRAISRHVNETLIIRP